MAPKRTAGADGSSGAEAPSGRYAYGVLRASEAKKPHESGVFGAPVRFARHNGLAAAVSVVDGPVPGRRQDLLAHFHVLEELGREVTVLPLRFGMVFDDEDQLVSKLLIRHGPLLQDLLRELDGTVELSLKAVYDQAVVMSEILAERRDVRRLSGRTRGLPEGATYFDRIRLGELVAEALAAKRERDAEDILAALAPLTIRFVSNAPTMEWIALSASFLVPRERLGEFEEVAGAITARVSDRMRLRVTGPIPPYSFVSLEGHVVRGG